MTLPLSALMTIEAYLAAMAYCGHIMIPQDSIDKMIKPRSLLTLAREMMPTCINLSMALPRHATPRHALASAIAVKQIFLTAIKCFPDKHRNRRINLIHLCRNHTGIKLSIKNLTEKFTFFFLEIFY
jgi:hypothetical protein